MGNRQLVVLLGLLGAIALIGLGIRANLAQTRIESALEGLTHSNDALRAEIHGELKGMTPDFSEDVTCGTRTITVATTCGQGTDPNGETVVPGETFANCLARHNRRVAATLKGCE